MLKKKILELEPEPVRAELLWVELKPKFLTWSQRRKKNIWSQSQEKCLSSATLVSIAMIFLFKYDMWGDFFQVF